MVKTVIKLYSRKCNKVKTVIKLCSRWWLFGEGGGGGQRRYTSEQDGTVCRKQVNVVVMRGQNDDEIGDFVELTRHQRINVRFIEYMPFDGNVWSDSKMVAYRDMVDAVTARFPQGLEQLQVGRAFALPNRDQMPYSGCQPGPAPSP
jgi:hypothetical protein